VVTNVETPIFLLLNAGLTQTPHIATLQLRVGGFVVDIELTLNDFLGWVVMSFLANYTYDKFCLLQIWRQTVSNNLFLISDIFNLNHHYRLILLCLVL